MSFACDRAAPYIVCAAMRYPNGFIVTGARHLDSVMHRQIPWMLHDQHGKAVQGFIDQRGNFYDRHEAWKIAEANGQIRFRCGGDTINGGMLFSENLY
jgi:hypothetical protein